MLFQKIKILFYYLKKPIFYRHLFFKLFYKFKVIPNNISKEKIEILLIHNYNIFDTKDFFEKELSLKYYVFSENEKYYYDNAIKIIDKLPIKMGGAANLDLIYSIIKNYQYKFILETGVAYGWSSLSILTSLYDNNQNKLISIDMPYPNFLSSEYVGVIIPEELKHNWILIKKSDRSALPLILKKNNFDLCHYDSDKSYFGRMWAYKNIWNNLSNGGVLISDDISDNMAFLDFAKLVIIKPYIIKFQKKYIGIIFKKF